MAVTTKGLCATIALLCVIVPIIVGHVMPTGTEERTVYESGNMVNISSDLVNESEIRYQEYISDFNNDPFLAYAPVSLSNNYSPIPNRLTTHFNGGNNPEYASGFNPFGEITVYTYPPFTTTIPENEYYRHFTHSAIHPDVTYDFTYGGVTYTASEIWAIPDRSLFMAIGSFGTLSIHDNFPSQIVPSSQYWYADCFGAVNPGNEYYPWYIDTAEGVYTTAAGSDPNHPEVPYSPMFTNGYHNARVGFNIENLQNTPRTHQITVYGGLDSVVLQLSYGSAGWTISNGTDSEVIGGFKQIYLDIDAKADEVRVSSLARGVFASNPYDRIIKTFTIPLVAGDGKLSGIDCIQFGLDSVEKLARAIVYSADIPAGNQAYITNNSVDLAAYYPMESLLIELSSFAFYGDSMTMPVIGTVAVDNGRITFTDTSGEERTVRLRDSTLAATYDEETQRYTVNINGYVFAEYIEAADLNLTFNGKWLFTIMLAPVMPRTVEEYVFSFSTLNITMEEFAFIGLITSLLAFVGCALVGKRSGQKVISLLLISGLAFMVYLAMLL